ncbi:MAG: hypothetical protein J6X98_03410, partial [Bacteroidales bacterium]|nr:hypothetical protein [Bacteroidales bacterium]
MHNGYLFDWEIVFDDNLAGGGGSIDSAAVLVPGDPNSPATWSEESSALFELTSDTSFIFHAPIVSQNTTISDTLRVYDAAGCWYDTTISITVTHVPGFQYPTQTVCAGGTINLQSQCEPGSQSQQSFDAITTGGDTWHSHSHTVGGETYYGPGNQEVDDFPAYVSALSDFPTRTKVFPAGGKVKLGIDGQPGSMTSVPRDLSDPFSVLVRAKGWGTEPGSSATPKKTRVNVVVDKGQPAEQIKFFETEPAYHWPGTDAYRNYSLLFDGASVASTITVETVNQGSGYDTRAFVDMVQMEDAGCTFTFIAPSGDTLQSGSSSTCTVNSESPAYSNGTFYVIVTPGNGECARRDSVEVTVNAPVAGTTTIAGNNTICAGGSGTTLTASTTGNNGTVTYNWSHGLGSGASVNV